jgi:hypothetical protein
VRPPLIQLAFSRSPCENSQTILKPILKCDSNLAGLLGVPHFQLVDRIARQFRIAMQVVRIEDRVHVAQTVPGDAGDARVIASDERQPRHRRAAQIVERHALDPCDVTRLEKRRAEAVGRPRPAVAIDEDDRRFARRRVEHRLERRADRDQHALAGLGLPQPNILAVIGLPCEPQQIALALAGP